MPLKFYTDTHIPKQVAIQLINKGVEVVRCEEVGLAEASDEEQLAYAAQAGLAMVSMDEDFQQLHVQWLENEKAHTGIFWISKHLKGKVAIGRVVGELLEYHQLVAAGAATLEADIHNQLFYIR